MKRSVPLHRITNDTRYLLNPKTTKYAKYDVIFMQESCKIRQEKCWRLMSTLDGDVMDLGKFVTPKNLSMQLLSRPLSIIWEVSVKMTQTFAFSGFKFVIKLARLTPCQQPTSLRNLAYYTYEKPRITSIIFMYTCVYACLRPSVQKVAVQVISVTWD